MGPSNKIWYNGYVDGLQKHTPKTIKDFGTPGEYASETFAIYQRGYNEAFHDWLKDQARVNAGLPPLTQGNGESVWPWPFNENEVHECVPEK